jgi:hypothetical protein
MFLKTIWAFALPAATSTNAMIISLIKTPFHDNIFTAFHMFRAIHFMLEFKGHETFSAKHIREKYTT